MAKTSTFKWNNVKNLLNRKKHNISFKEAQYAFSELSFLNKLPANMAVSARE